MAKIIQTATDITDYEWEEERKTEWRRTKQKII